MNTPSHRVIFDDSRKITDKIIKDYKKAMQPALKYWQGGK